MRLVLIPPDHMPEAWPHLAPFLEKIGGGHHGSEGRRSGQDIALNIMEGRELCWSVLDGGGNPVAVVLGSMIQFPKRRILRISSCVGEGRREWLPLLSEIEDYAKSHGCADVEIICRKGWARDLPDYRLTHVVLVRSVQ